MATENIEKSMEIESIAKKKHILELIGNEPSYLHRAAAEILQVHGIPEISAGRSRSKARKSIECKSGRLYCSQFVDTNLGSSGVKVCVPNILKETTEFIRKQIEVEGIFRKSGSSSRKQIIMDRLNSSNLPAFLLSDTVFDVCAVMKQFLREMTQPLIPRDLHSLFVSCLGLCDKDTVAESILLAVFLLPLQNIHVLSYLLQFLHEVSQHSTKNQMGARNLAVVIAPNIMPIEEKKLAKGLHQHYERIALDNHVKVVEILIENGELVGYINEKFEKVLSECFLSRPSEEGESSSGRKKRHRSGSLTRVFGGIFWKGKNGKDCETPSDAHVPDFKTPSGVHTPVIMGAAKRSQNDYTLKSETRRKNTILDAVRYYGLTGPEGSATPNSLIACPSPLVCLDPSPFALSSNGKMSGRDKRSPNVSEWSNFYTPELFGRRRAKRSPENTSSVLITNGKFKTKLLFGRKTGKKQALREEAQAENKLQKTAFTSSKMSIHRLARSPRAGKLIRVPSRIPVPEYSPYSSSCKDSVSASEKENTEQEEYVTISEAAEISDEKNEAFISSPISLERSEGIDTQQSPYIFSSTDQERTIRVMPFYQAPWEVASSEPMGMDMDTGEEQDQRKQVFSNVMETVAHEFTKTVRESRIIELVSESKLNRKSLPVLSFREKGVSPSQKIIRSARRKSHEVPGTPVQTQSPRFMSLRSPKSRPTPPPIIARSPSRCTLQRGRPNTMRAGLARPSPTTVQPNAAETNYYDSVAHETSLRRVTLDRKGRVGRRNTCRPVLPQVQSKGILNEYSDSETVKNIHFIDSSTTSRLNKHSKEKSSYIASKLKLDNDMNVLCTPGRAARSYSMRDDLFISSKASPMRSYLLARTQRSGIPRYQFPNSEHIPILTYSRPTTPLAMTIPLRRMLSVQEIVRRIETSQNQNENCPPNNCGKNAPTIKTNQFIKKSQISLTRLGTKTQPYLGQNPNLRGSPVLKTINHA